MIYSNHSICLIKYLLENDIITTLLHQNVCFDLLTPVSLSQSFEGVISWGNTVIKYNDSIQRNPNKLPVQKVKHYMMIQRRFPMNTTT